MRLKHVRRGILLGLQRLWTARQQQRDIRTPPSSRGLSSARCISVALTEHVADLVTDSFSISVASVVYVADSDGINDTVTKLFRHCFSHSHSEHVPFVYCIANFITYVELKRVTICHSHCELHCIAYDKHDAKSQHDRKRELEFDRARDPKCDYKPHPYQNTEQQPDADLELDTHGDLHGIPVTVPQRTIHDIAVAQPGDLWHGHTERQPGADVERDSLADKHSVPVADCYRICISEF